MVWGGESRGVPDCRGPRHRHWDRAAPPVELQHLRGALEADDPRAVRPAPQLLLRDGEVEAESHELAQGATAQPARITGYVRVDVSEGWDLNMKKIRNIIEQLQHWTDWQ